SAAAGMLLSGILSDTLVLKMSTTTPRDIEAVEYLAGVTGLDPVEYGTTLIQQGMELDSVPLHELMTRDTKPYTLFGKDLIIAQVMTASGEYAIGRAAEIRKNLDLLRKENGVDIYLCLFTNVIETRSALFASADNSVLTALEYDDQPVILDGVMSRKKDFLPGFGNRLRNL
ncbi:MAG TPA: inorganic diphosphatase, partial [Methanolinea sp.]|nr:inorganic diphosphatase [Methanolinea sp.]